MDDQTKNDPLENPHADFFETNVGQPQEALGGSGNEKTHLSDFLAKTKTDPETILQTMKDVEGFIQLLGRYKDKDLPPPVTQLTRKDGENEFNLIGSDADTQIKLYGVEHNNRSGIIEQVKEEIEASPADVYFVEVLPSILPTIYECPDAETAFQKYGESGYVAWLANSAGKEVRTWERPFVENLEEGLKKLGPDGIEPLLGSFVGSGMLHVIDREGEGTGNRAAAFMRLIEEVGIGEDVKQFFEKHGAPLTEEAINNVFQKYAGKDVHAMTKEEVSRFFEPYGEGPVNKANAACNEPRDDHAIREFYKAKQEPGVNKIVVVAGKDHTRLWQRPLEAMYPEEVKKVQA